MNQGAIKEGGIIKERIEFEHDEEDLAGLKIEESSAFLVGYAVSKRIL